MYEKKDDHIYNTSIIINPEGEVVTRYRKMFPFLPYEAGVTPGDEFCVFDVPEVGRFGVSICYDMWIPETMRTLVVNGAQVILHPTFTASIDREIELAIARASSAQHQCYIFDINGLGAGGTGHSIICGPDGYVIYQAGSGEEMMPLEINVDRVRRSRERGVRGLGQPLKSFRDSNVKFDVYSEDYDYSYLHSLGPLEKMKKRQNLHEDSAEDEPLPASAKDYLKQVDSPADRNIHKGGAY